MTRISHSAEDKGTDILDWHDSFWSLKFTPAWPSISSGAGKGLYTFPIISAKKRHSNRDLSGGIFVGWHICISTLGEHCEWYISKANSLFILSSP